jgi:esterase/lipase superfamily enzyme
MNPNKHVCLQHIQTLDQDSTFNCIARYVHSTPDRKLFLLIHGYNVSFADAARRTGQLANDLQFDGAAVFFSWPSQASVSAYTVDETNSQWTRPHYKQFLLRLLETVKAETVFLMAHSMGNRVLARTLVELVNSGQAEKLTAVKEIIFIAPDIDADDFEDNLAPRITQLGIPVTLYVSSEDKALKASKKVHGYQRAGEKVLVIPGVETIDATFASDDFLGHSYFASSRDIISDLYYLFKDHIRAKKRFGLESKNDEFWMLKK